MYQKKKKKGPKATTLSNQYVFIPVPMSLDVGSGETIKKKCMANEFLYKWFLIRYDGDNEWLLNVCHEQTRNISPEFVDQHKKLCALDRYVFLRCSISTFIWRQKYCVVCHCRHNCPRSNSNGVLTCFVTGSCYAVILQNHVISESL